MPVDFGKVPHSQVFLSVAQLPEGAVAAAAQGVVLTLPPDFVAPVAELVGAPPTLPFAQRELNEYEIYAVVLMYVQAQMNSMRMQIDGGNRPGAGLMMARGGAGLRA